MIVDVIGREELEDAKQRALESIPGTKEWTENRLLLDKKLRQKVFLEKCEKLGISSVRVIEMTTHTAVTIGFYALVAEQEYGIEKSFKVCADKTLLDIVPEIIDATKLWNSQLLELIKTTAEMKGLL